MMGIVDWATGDFLAAAPRLRRVAELYAAGSGNVTDLRYSQDHSVWSLSLLALALWPLGFVDQAIEAASKALARAQQINHAMTTAFALIFGSTLCEFIRADPLRGGHLFDEALDYCVNNDLRTYFPWSRFYGGLSLINRGQLDQGLEMMRGRNGRREEDQHETSLDATSRQSCVGPCTSRTRRSGARFIIGGLCRRGRHG